MSEEFTELIPSQWAEVNRLFTAEKLASYSLSLEKGKLWAIVNAADELEVLDIIGRLPLSPFMEKQISPLAFHNVIAKLYPSFSLN
jgi:muconolactone delta-isomerase